MSKKTRQVQVGSVRIGGGAPVSVQSMTNTDTADVEKTLSQIRALTVAGADIVRAAVSALTQTALNGLANVLKAPVRFEQDDSRAFIEAELTPEATEEQIQQAQLLLVTLLEGLQAIQRGYPRNVRIIFKERR